MSEWTQQMPWLDSPLEATDLLLTREWLVANGLGGYACGTIAGVASRRYHSLLIAALPAPLGRQIMFNHLTELLRFEDGSTITFGGEERHGSPLQVPGAPYLKSFRLELGLPVWRYDIDSVAIEKRIFLPHQQNSVYVNYRMVEGKKPIRLKLRPSLHFRPYDAPVGSSHYGDYSFQSRDDRYEISVQAMNLPPLRLYLHGQRRAFTLESTRLEDVLYRIEETRGYDSRGTLWSPGYFRADLTPEQEVTLVGSTEGWETVLALRPMEALKAEHNRRRRLIEEADASVRTGSPHQLVLAADQFIITPAGRIEEAARAHAAGDEVRTVIAGYHWFTDWGRDTMISLEGLTLTTGRLVEAGYILRTFGHYVRDGLIPNMFPEGERDGLYHTADATLWYFHALSRYLTYTKDRATLQLLLPTLLDIIEHHNRGTRFGIGIDPNDGLLRQGQQGYQLTWMDAKVGDWVVTPRRGKAVEINALWYNALCLLANWLREENDPARADKIAQEAERARRSFNKRFWYADGGYLYDVIDGENGDDPACRPNQIFAISLPHPILDEQHWPAVLKVVTDRLLTPVGLRSLAPGHPDYKARYYGDLRARDAAYHQGTVWCWLIGPYIDAWQRVHPLDRAGARRFLQGFQDHLSEVCIGSISEICDAEAPFAPRGCVAQAWSVAEVLRCWASTAETPNGKGTTT
ncbi:MAG TPA: amylo-alpha-1,6-glucosidase [Gemmataceae bacterium]|nr:amylo-alpha-1,6-glucosidase [Gemmataceae bacterium]